MSVHSDRRLARFVASTRGRFGILAAVVVIAAGVWFWRSVVRVHGFIVSLAALDATHAVVCVRANHEYGYAARAWVAVMDTKGGYVWAKRLPGLPPVAAHEGLLVEDGVAYVRTLDDDDRAGQTTAFRLSDGEVLWTTRFASARPSLTVDLLSVGPSLVEGIDEGRTWKAVSIAKATGAVEWEQRFDDHMVALRSRGSRLVVEDASGTVHASTPTFDVVRREACIADGEAAILAPKDAEHPARILARRFDGGVVRTVAEPVPWEEGTIHTPVACATHAGRFVFFVRTTKLGDAKPTESLALVEADMKRGGPATVTTVATDRETVGAVSSAASSLPAFREESALRGEVPRFIPLSAYDGGTFRFLVLDLEERRVRRGPPMDHTFVAFHAGDRYVLHHEAGFGPVALFDGATGALTAAVTTTVRGAALKPHHVRDGRLWLYRTSWLSPLPFAVLDAKTLAKVDATMPVTDVLAATRKAWLGE